MTCKALCDNPKKPVFNKDAFDIAKYTSTASVDDSTWVAPPTPAPLTALAGQVIEQVQVTIKVVKVELAFPLSLDEANHPAMRNALECGFAQAIGFLCKYVKVDTIAAVSRRRLTDSVKVTFKVESLDDSAAGTADLVATVESAAAEGAIVANIQDKANENNVLTAALLNMPREVTVTASVEDDVKIVEQAVAGSECVDDADGDLAANSANCGDLKAGITCDGDLNTLNPLAPVGTILKGLCPLSCNYCVEAGFLAPAPAQTPAPTKAPTNALTQAPTSVPPTPPPAPTPEVLESGAGAISLSHTCLALAIVQATVFALM
jgi:hypothetical protein